MNIGSMEILRNVEGKKRNLQSGIMGIMWKARGKMVIPQRFKKILEGPKCIKEDTWSSLTK